MPFYLTNMAWHREGRGGPYLDVARQRSRQPVKLPAGMAHVVGVAAALRNKRATHQQSCGTAPREPQHSGWRFWPAEQVAVARRGRAAVALGPGQGQDTRVLLYVKPRVQGAAAIERKRGGDMDVLEPLGYRGASAQVFRAHLCIPEPPGVRLVPLETLLRQHWPRLHAALHAPI